MNERLTGFGNLPTIEDPVRSIHPHDTYTTEDGKVIRMIGKNMLVKIDEPPKQTASGLVLYASGSMENVNNTGTVVAKGYEYTED
ncbi:MAG: hypothetical protein WCP53_13360, partial [Verrucomicrobiota bacterium]